HAAEALYLFLNSRLYRYHQVYFHRTVRRSDLQRRELFRPTLELLLGGNPRERLDRYQALTEWSLLSDVDRWAHGHGDANQRELGQAWADVVARKLKWKLIYQGRTDARDIPSAALSVTPDQFASELRTRLPANLRHLAVRQLAAVGPARANRGEAGHEPAWRVLAAVWARGVGRGVAAQQRRRPCAALLAAVLVNGHGYDSRRDPDRSRPRGRRTRPAA